MKHPINTNLIKLFLRSMKHFTAPPSQSHVFSWA